ncbi:hypothetical protein [Streptomyces sp.]|uniref:hypothetical protein n=1 Tax=Streptomyces sp. TaxID=1931 RepID=UPI002F41EB60
MRVQPSATASAPVPGENLLARAIAELADAASGAMGAGPAVGTLTYTSADGHTVSVPVDVYAERQIARELYEAAQDARALRALANGRVAGNVRTVVAAAANSSRRPLTVIAGGAS